MRLIPYQKGLPQTIYPIFSKTLNVGIIVTSFLFFLFIGFVAQAQLPETEFESFFIGRELLWSKGDFISATEDEYGFLWIAPGNGPGAIRYDGYGFQYFLVNDDKRHSISSIYVSAMASFWNNKVYIGTNGDLNIYDIAKDSVYHLLEKEELRTIDGTVGITKIVNDAKGNIWIGCHNGFREFDPYTEKFEWYYSHGGPDDRDAEFKPNRVWSLCVDKDSSNLVWLGTSDGLYLFNTHDFSFKEFFHPSNPNQHLKIYELKQDENGWIWATCYNEDNGLYGFHPVKNLWKKYKIKTTWKNEILHHDLAVRFCTDPTGKLWIGTNKGIVMFDKDTEQFDSYIHDPADSLTILANKHYYTDCFIDRHGVLWVLGIKGFSRSLSSVSKGRRLPNPIKVLVAEIKVNQQPFQLPYNTFILDTLQLKNHQNSLQFKMVLPNPFQPDSTLYAYRLLNHDEEWKQSNSRTIRYDDLWSGQYILELKAKDGKKDWTPINRIVIDIEKPSFLTAGFLMPCLFGTSILACLVFLLYRKWVQIVSNLPVENIKNDTSSSSVPYLVFPTNKGVKYIQPMDIVRCEADNNYTQVLLQNGKKILFSKTLKHMEAILPDFFVRVHQSHIVNKKI